MISGVSDVVVSGDPGCTVEDEDLGRLLEVLGANGIMALTSAPPTLEELFMEQYRAIPAVSACHRGARGASAGPAAAA